jgi:hypothetical protein
VFGVPASREEYHGFSHREFGSYTDAYAFLIETSNPGQESSILNPDVVNDPLAPLSSRVRTQLATTTTLLNNYASVVASDQAIRFTFPFPLNELEGANLGDYLR